MELTRKALNEVKFHTRGKWYNGRQVDEFIQELTVCLDEAGREHDSLKREAEKLRQELELARKENAGLEQELKSLRESASGAQRDDIEEHRRKICEELEWERDKLISDIKVLHRFRETFKEAVEQDANALLASIGRLDSKKLL